MDIKIYRFKINPHVESSVKAFVDLIIDGELIIKGFKLIEGKEGIFLANPSDKNKEGTFFESVRFVSLETKKVIEKIVIERFKTDYEIEMIKKEKINDNNN